MGEIMRLNFVVENDLYSEFKAYCARKGRTMTDVILEFISSALETEVKEVSEKSEIAVPPFLRKEPKQLEEKRTEDMGTEIEAFKEYMSEQFEELSLKVKFSLEKLSLKIEELERLEKEFKERVNVSVGGGGIEYRLRRIERLLKLEVKE